MVSSPNIESKVKRITITFQVINNARYIIFLVAGKEKLKIIKRTISGHIIGDSKLPAGKVRPKNGEIFWFIAKKI